MQNDRLDVRIITDRGMNGFVVYETPRQYPVTVVIIIVHYRGGVYGHVTIIGGCVESRGSLQNIFSTWGVTKPCNSF